MNILIKHQKLQTNPFSLVVNIVNNYYEQQEIKVYDQKEKFEFGF